MALFKSHRIPSSQLAAQHHRQATLFATQQAEDYSCPCCLLPIKDAPLPINFDPAALDVFGKQYAEFFRSCKALLAAMAIFALTVGMPLLHDSLVVQNPNNIAGGGFECHLSPLQEGFPQSKFIFMSLLSFVILFGILLALRVSRL